MSSPRKVDARDLIAIAGLVLVVAGAGWIYRPLAPILAGSMLFLYAYVTVKKPQ